MFGQGLRTGLGKVALKVSGMISEVEVQKICKMDRILAFPKIPFRDCVESGRVQKHVAAGRD